jgi:hypothetical protein
MKKLASLALAALLSVAAALPSRGAILFQGGELPDFTTVGSVTATTGTAGTTHRSGYAREVLQPGAAASSSDPPTNYIRGSFAGASSIWAHFFYYSSGLTATSSNSHLVRFIDSAGNAAVVIRGTGTAGQLKFQSRSSGGTFTDLLSTCNTGMTGNLQQFDIQLVFAGAGGGSIVLYVDGIQVCSYSGTTTNGDGSSTITNIDLDAPTTSTNPSFSEVIVADEDTRSMSRVSLYPSTSGATTGWTNSSGTTPCSTTILAQTSQNDANYVFTGSSSTVELCTPGQTLPAGNWTVKTVGFGARALKGTTGPQTLTFMVREGSTNYTLSPTATLSGAFAKSSNNNYANDPATSSAWTSTTINTAGFQLGFQSSP